MSLLIKIDDKFRRSNLELDGRHLSRPLVATLSDRISFLAAISKDDGSFFFSICLFLCCVCVSVSLRVSFVRAFPLSDKKDKSCVVTPVKGLYCSTGSHDRPTDRQLGKVHYHLTATTQKNIKSVRDTFSRHAKCRLRVTIEKKRLKKIIKTKRKE